MEFSFCKGSGIPMLSGRHFHLHAINQYYVSIQSQMNRLSVSSVDQSQESLSLFIGTMVLCFLNLDKARHVGPLSQPVANVAVHLGVKMADTLSFTAKVDMVKCEVV